MGNHNFFDLSAHCRFQNGKQTRAFEVESAADVRDELVAWVFCPHGVLLPAEVGSLLLCGHSAVAVLCFCVVRLFFAGCVVDGDGVPPLSSRCEPKWHESLVRPIDECSWVAVVVSCCLPGCDILCLVVIHACVVEKKTVNVTHVKTFKPVTRRTCAIYGHVSNSQGLRIRRKCHQSEPVFAVEMEIQAQHFPDAFAQSPHVLNTRGAGNSGELNNRHGKIDRGVT